MNSKIADMTRRNYLTTAASGLGGAALTSMLASDGAFGGEVATEEGPLLTRETHFEPKAKSCMSSLSSTSRAVRARLRRHLISPSTLP